jgi:hypothetical protein
MARDSQGGTGFERLVIIMADTSCTAPPSSESSIPSVCSLETWVAYEWRNGVQVPELEPLDRLLVRTCNHIYEIIVLQPGCAEVMVRGGQFFPEFTRVRVAGSSLGGGFLKLHGVYRDFCLELHGDHRAVVTSPVREIMRGTVRAAA